MCTRNKEMEVVSNFGTQEKYPLKAEANLLEPHVCVVSSLQLCLDKRSRPAMAFDHLVADHVRGGFRTRGARLDVARGAHTIRVS